MKKYLFLITFLFISNIIVFATTTRNHSSLNTSTSSTRISSNNNLENWSIITEKPENHTSQIISESNYSLDWPCSIK